MRVLLAALLLTVAGQAHAACTQANLAGKWNAYLTLAFQQNVGLCTLVIKPDGSLAKTSRCLLANIDAVPSGQLTIGPTCMFNGTIRIENTDYQIWHATLKGGIAAGIGVGQYFSFTMVKN